MLSQPIDHFYLESEQGWPRTAGHELEELPLLRLAEVLDDLPEADDRLVDLAEPVAVLRVQHLHMKIE